MRGRSAPLVRPVLVLLAGLLLILGVPATGGADPPGLDSLQAKSSSLAAQSRAAVVELYALESRLARVRSDAARLETEAAGLKRRRAAAQRRYRAARKTMAIAQQRLGRQLRILYELGEPDPFAIVLGATSLAEAIEGLESLSRTARATADVLQQAKKARKRVAVEKRALAVRLAETARARARAAAAAAGLERARSERSAYLARLRSEQELTRAQITRLEAQAREAQRRAQEVTRQAEAEAEAAEAEAETAAETTTSEPASPAETQPSVSGGRAAELDDLEPAPDPVESVSQETPPAPQPAAPPPRAGRTMLTVSTGYCLTGTTATGLPVGPGIVAVDPTVIPLGTRMTIPGYGESVAADTGSAIKGNRIDLWFPSCRQALDWGWRTVTVTFL